MSDFFPFSMQNLKGVSFFFLFFKICFIYLSFYFTILYWFCHTLTWILHECICVPHPEPPSYLPAHTIPLGHPSAPAPSTLYHASNLDWWFVSHVIIYMFQCHCPISSHPRPLPQSPKDCSIPTSFPLAMVPWKDLGFATWVEDKASIDFFT